MQLALLRAFLVTRDEGSISAAALRLHIAQSSLTRQIAALEQEVGARLFDRGARGVALTAAGQALASAVESPLDALESAIRNARRFGQGARREVRIGYLQSLARSYLNPALAALRVAHPGVRVKLFDLCAGGQMRALEAGEIDVALIGQEGRLLARKFYTRRIRTARVLAVLSEDHALAARPAIRLSDLRRELLVAKDPEESPGYNEWIVGLFRRVGLRPRFGPQAESLSEMFSLVLSDGAVALVPEVFAEGCGPSVVARPIADVRARWELLVVWQRGRLAEPIKSFLDALPTLTTEPERVRALA